MKFRVSQQEERVVSLVRVIITGKELVPIRLSEAVSVAVHLAEHVRVAGVQLIRCDNHRVAILLVQRFDEVYLTALDGGKFEGKGGEAEVPGARDLTERPCEAP